MPALIAILPLLLSMFKMGKDAIDEQQAGEKSAAAAEADRKAKELATRTQSLTMPEATPASAQASAPAYNPEAADYRPSGGTDTMQSAAQSILGMQQQLPGMAKDVPSPSDSSVVRPGNQMGTPDPLTGTVNQLSAPSVVNMQKWISDWSPFRS